MGRFTPPLSPHLHHVLRLVLKLAMLCCFLERGCFLSSAFGGKHFVINYGPTFCHLQSLVTEYGPTLCHFQSLVENILYYRPTLCRLQPLVRNVLYYRSTLCYPQCLVENILHYVSVLDTERGQKRQPLVLFKARS